MYVLCGPCASIEHDWLVCKPEFNLDTWKDVARSAGKIEHSNWLIIDTLREVCTNFYRPATIGHVLQ